MTTIPVYYYGVGNAPRNTTEVDIASNLTAIGEGAFSCCPFLSDIKLPPSIITIGESAFYNCASLSSITLPSSLTTIERSAFSLCISLSTIIIPASVTTIKQHSFSNCTSLSNIKIPPSLTYIEYNAFYRCSNLNSIEIHPSLPYIIITNNDGFTFRTGTNVLSHVDCSSINEKLGKLSNVFQKSSFSPVSQETSQLLGIGKKEVVFNHEDKIFVNWTLYSQKKNEQGRLLLFTASEQGVKWSDGMCNILNGYGAAIEEVDVVTGLEAFMLAAVGEESDMETIFKLLQDHPAAINPYVVMPQQQYYLNRKKRKFSQ